MINDKDSTYNSTQTLMAVTPEITTGNHIKLEIDAEIKNEISSGKVYLQAPAGLNVLIHFPTRKIIETFEDAVGGSGSASTVQGLVNSLTLRIPVKTVSSNYNLDPPQFLLLFVNLSCKSFSKRKNYLTM